MSQAQGGTTSGTGNGLHVTTSYLTAPGCHGKEIEDTAELAPFELERVIGKGVAPDQCDRFESGCRFCTITLSISFPPVHHSRFQKTGYPLPVFHVLDFLRPVDPARTILMGGEFREKLCSFRISRRYGGSCCTENPGCLPEHSPAARERCRKKPCGVHPDTPSKSPQYDYQPGGRRVPVGPGLP